jgi:hypothetical protein
MKQTGRHHRINRIAKVLVTRQAIVSKIRLRTARTREPYATEGSVFHGANRVRVQGRVPTIQEAIAIAMELPSTTFGTLIAAIAGEPILDEHTTTVEEFDVCDVRRNIKESKLLPAIAEILIGRAVA